MIKQYYAYHVVKRKNDDRLWFQFHTGTNRTDVREGRSLNQGLLLFLLDKDESKAHFQEVFKGWEDTIELYELERA